MTADVTSGLWQALLSAVERGQSNPNGYTFALVDKTATPETITIWHNGRIVLHGVANTGAPTTPTPNGTWPVYLRRPAQIMRGLYPDGKPYADPVQYVSFFNGDYAVHSMQRASYGTAQSLGCVELPLSEAKKAYPYLTYGSLVTVTGGPLDAAS
jgi:lipoprotein-anchoring transpeptidase ErfK/SrfK